MPTICGVLTSYEFNCDFPESGGASDEMMLIPHSIIDRAQGVDGFALNVQNPTIIEDIFIKAGSQAVTMRGKRNPNSIMATPVVEGSATGFNHSAVFPAYEMSPDMAQRLKFLQNEKVLVILKTNQRNSTGNNLYKVAGRQVGMYLSEGEYNSAENNGVTNVTLSTPDELMESNAMEFFFITDIPTTNAAYESLKDIAVAPPA